MSVPELQAQHGHHRDQRVAQDVAAQHRPLREPLGPGRAHVVLGERLQHARAQRARDHRGQRQPQRDGRQDERAQPAPAFFQRIQIAGDRQPAQRHAEDEDQQECQQEVGHADAEQCERGAGAVQRSVVTVGGEDPEREGDQQRDRHGQRGELEARADAAADALDDGLAVADRATEVAAQQAAHPGQRTARRCGWSRPSSRRSVSFTVASTDSAIIASIGSPG